MTKEHNFIPYNKYTKYSEKEMEQKARNFYEFMQQRHTVRTFSDQPVPQNIIENCIKTAGTAPNGANMQPWHFVAVQDINLKKEIRIEAEKEETKFYEQRASDEWLEALEPFGTTPEKPFLEKAPYIIAIFAEKYGVAKNGKKIKNYYVKESVGIATGMLITAIHTAGLACLTHTPSPMGFLNEILDRPKNERPFLLLVVGYPGEDAQVPDIDKKPLHEIATFR